MGELLVEKADFVATITLNRPERLNAIAGPMLGALSEALVDADKDPEGWKANRASRRGGTSKLSAWA